MSTLNLNKPVQSRKDLLQPDKALAVSRHSPLLRSNHTKKTCLSISAYTCIATWGLFTDKQHHDSDCQIRVCPVSQMIEVGHSLPVRILWAAYGSPPGQLLVWMGETWRQIGLIQNRRIRKMETWGHISTMTNY